MYPYIVGLHWVCCWCFTPSELKDQYEFFDEAPPSVLSVQLEIFVIYLLAIGLGTDIRILLLLGYPKNPHHI